MTKTRKALRRPLPTETNSTFERLMQMRYNSLRSPVFRAQPSRQHLQSLLRLVVRHHVTGIEYLHQLKGQLCRAIPFEPTERFLYVLYDPATFPSTFQSANSALLKPCLPVHSRDSIHISLPIWLQMKS